MDGQIYLTQFGVGDNQNCGSFTEEGREPVEEQASIDLLFEFWK